MSGAVNKLNLTQNAINKFKKPIKTPVTPVADVDNEAGGTEKDVGTENLSYNNPVVKFSVDTDPNAVEDV